MLREAGYRTKIAVSSIDSKVDAVGACVGVRGTRIKSIIDELNGERIDIIRWNDDGKIQDFKVMVRPLKAINKVWEKMAAMLAAQAG